MNFFIAQFLT